MNEQERRIRAVTEALIGGKKPLVGEIVVIEGNVDRNFTGKKAVVVDNDPYRVKFLDPSVPQSKLPDGSWLASLGILKRTFEFMEIK